MATMAGFFVGILRAMHDGAACKTIAFLPVLATLSPMSTQLPWLEPDDPFPHPERAWGPADPAPGLLAAGATLDVAHLRSAYAQGTFPWYGPGQPILWWAPDPRMVLPVSEFRLHRSLRRKLQAFRAASDTQIRIDHACGEVIAACAGKARSGQTGTWIVPEMVAAYTRLHEAGLAHSVETWVGGRLVGGLYCVAIGQAVFGESMFAHATDASKIALAALVALCRHHGVQLIDCQQNTQHLASLGAREIARSAFLAHVQSAQHLPAPAWTFEPVYWNELLPTPVPTA
jgi:leucyl/phenylalanyl-tRNA--protein transferase